MHHHYRGSDSVVPYPRETPRRFDAPATPPSDAGSPRTTATLVDHGPRPERQTDNRCDGVCMVAQKGPPALRWRATTFDHVLGNRRLGDREAELQQFTMDARGAPYWVLLAHSPDQFTQLTCDLRPTRPTSRFPAPIGQKPCSVPSQDRIGLDHARQSNQDWPQPSHQYQQSPVTRTEPQTMRRTPQGNIELVPQKRVSISRRRRERNGLATNVASRWKNASIMSNDELILPHYANPPRIRFSGGTGRDWIFHSARNAP
jgi:hypothetical protein